MCLPLSLPDLRTRQKENKLRRSQRASNDRHIEPSCVHDKTKQIKSKSKGSREDDSLITAQLCNLKSISAQTCWHSASGRWWSNFLHAEAKWFLPFSQNTAFFCQNTTISWGLWESCFRSIKNHQVFIVSKDEPRACKKIRNKLSVNFDGETNKSDKNAAFEWSYCALTEVYSISSNSFSQQMSSIYSEMTFCSQLWLISQRA